MRGILIAALVAMFVSLFGTPVAIKMLLRRRYGQEIKIRAPETHRGKQGTPTMGGTVILLAAILGYAAAKLVTWRGPSVSALLALGLATGLGLVGFADDFIKIRMQRNLGLRARTKLVGQVGVAVAFAVLALQFRNAAGYTPASTHISFVRDTGLALGAAGFVIWALLIVSATSNSVNLTDGLDGLAAGASAMVFGAMVAIIFSQARNNCAISNHVGCYQVRDPFDLAIVAAGFGGACVGFLWWNASPARIFMGDTGSLALGGAIAGLAILSRIELLLFVLCGLFVIITMSSVIQIVSFRYTGKRVFKMAPLQHHFEMKGWQEITIVIRFWIIAAIAVALALGIFYAERLTWTAT